MQNIRTILVLVLLVAGSIVRAQDPSVIQAYIDTYKDIAIAEMQRTGVPASIKLAQGIHETTAGTSALVKKSNNHFGIKCKTGWTGESVSHTDDAPNECFRKYDEPAQSYRDHSDFLKNSSRYASLFSLDPLDYQGWAYGLKKAGYATNPRYPQIIIRLVEEYHLQDYTLIAMGRMAPKEDVAAVDKTTEKIPEETQPVAITPAKTEAADKRPSYPSGEFRINETRVIFAQKGTSLLAIAQQYNIPLARVFEFNDMDEIEALLKDQLVYLQRKRKTGNNEFHIVQPGETVYDIAREQAIRLDALLEYNRLQRFMRPAAGERLYLRSKAPGMPKLASNNANDGSGSNVKRDKAVYSEQQ
jgi:Mannosyl-glycoprotein endo-beta-N-acetylglucosaminidase/LysM domain